MIDSPRLHRICQMIESEIRDVFIGASDVNVMRLRQKVIIELPAELYDKIFRNGGRQVVIRGVRIRRGL